MDTLIASMVKLLTTTGEFVSVWYLHILASIVVILMIVRGIIYLQKKGFNHKKYKNIDSQTLDAEPEILSSFYSDAYQYRISKGSARYHRYILTKYEFVYRFHTLALEWIDEIVTRTLPVPPRLAFVLAAIRSGQLEHVFSETSYGNGLDNPHIRPGEPLFICCKTGSVEIWSPWHDTSLCSLDRYSMELQRANKQQGFVTGILSAKSSDNANSMNLTLRFPEYRYDSNEKQLRHHEVYATENYQLFATWIKTNCTTANSVVSSFNSNQNDYGIEVDYGIDAPELLDHSHERLFSLPYKLRTLEGRVIDASLQSRFRHASSDFSSQFFVAMCSGFGLVVIIENSYTGLIKYNSDAGWIVHENNRSQIIANSCLQARRVTKHIQHMLDKNSLTSWPLHPLVVFSANSVSLQEAVGKKPLQCQVVRLTDLESWLRNKSKVNNIRFTKDDFNHFALLLNSKKGQYHEQTESIA